MTMLLIRLSFLKKPGKTGNNGSRNIEIMVPLKYLSNVKIPRNAI